MTLSEIETRAKQMIQAACPDDLMEVECLTTDRETGRVFVVLRAIGPALRSLLPLHFCPCFDQSCYVPIFVKFDTIAKVIFTA